MVNLRRLKGLRVEKNLTQEQLAEKIQMPISTYRKKENGESPIKLEEAYAISKALNTCLDTIFFNNEVPEVEQSAR